MTDYIQPEDEYPLWRVAVSNILDKFEAEGYGALITKTELYEWMGIRKAEKVEDVQKEQLDYLIGIEKTKLELIENYNLLIYRVIGKGFEILHPEDQIRKGADCFLNKSQRALKKFVTVLVNTDVNKLSIESRQLQSDKMNRAAFIKASFRKRELPKPNNIKEIEDN